MVVPPKKTRTAQGAGQSRQHMLVGDNAGALQFTFMLVREARPYLPGRALRSKLSEKRCGGDFAGEISQTTPTLR